MKWLFVAGVAGPMLAAAAMGPDLWFKLSFIAGALYVLVLIFTPERQLYEEVEQEEEMPPFMTTEQVLAFVERKKRSA